MHSLDETDYLYQYRRLQQRYEQVATGQRRHRRRNRQTGQMETCEESLAEMQQKLQGIPRAMMTSQDEALQLD